MSFQALNQIRAFQPREKVPRFVKTKGIDVHPQQLVAVQL